MSWIDPNRGIGPETGSIGYHQFSDKLFLCRWTIAEFSVRHGYLTRMVSPPFHIFGIEWNLIMYSKFQKRKKNGNFSLTLWGKSTRGVITYSERLLIKYKLTVEGGPGRAKDVKVGEEQFFGYHVSLAHHDYMLENISYVTSEEDEFLAYVEMEFNKAQSVW